ncbi:M12 family metallopeptidase [Spongiivirga sp. MCCC 1A20706]|uniref:DUF7452 domain-containing protein n=1 Tax=Spongiivirga sp. MCCC 1A20706 TaxID=3160963 RepID=UPI003977A9BD
MKTFIIFPLLFLVSSVMGQIKFDHTSTAINTRNHITTINHPATNNKPGAILIVTQEFGKYNAHEIGVWYSNNKWHIFNQDRSKMPLTTHFNVLIFPKNSNQAFVHKTNASNTRGHITTLNNRLTNGKPNEIVLVTQNYGAYNTANVGVWYSQGKWKLYNENTSKKMPLNTKMNVLVLKKGNNKIGKLNLYGFNYQETRTTNHISKIKSPLQYTRSTTVFANTNYKGTYNSNPIGVWKNGKDWTIFNQNRKKMPRGVRFNVVLTNEPTGSNTTNNPRPVPILTKRVTLPMFNRPENISYYVEKGLAMFQGDIVLGTARNVVDPPPKPLPKKRNFSQYGEIRPTRPSSGVSSTTSALVTRVSDGLINRNWLWNKGIIPYLIKSGDFSNAETRVILDAIDEINRRTNLNIVPKWKVQNHIRFIKDRDMNAAGKSKVGRGRIFQRIRLNQDVSRNTVIHELLHAAGAWHEQSRSDRDRHVRILWDNIQSGTSSNFKKHASDGYKVTPYDENSIMHYGGYAFSKDGSPTIVNARTGNPVTPGSGLSSYDVDGINTIYPFDFYDGISRPVTSIRTVKTTILRVQSDDRDGGRKHDIDFYMKNETGPGWDWRPGGRTNPTERFKSGTKEEGDNDIYPNWEFRYTIARNEPFAKVWLKLRDDDGLARNERTDETVDINPFPGIKEIELFVDTASGEIFLGDIDGVRKDENYIGSIGENIELEGFDRGIKAYVLFNILIE